MVPASGLERLTPRGEPRQTAVVTVKNEAGRSTDPRNSGSDPRPSRRGRSRHRWSCRVSRVCAASSSGGNVAPAGLCRGRVSFREPSRQIHAHMVTTRTHFSRIRAHTAAPQMCACTIACSMLAPCSASSMLFAALRPGRWPGLRALTTPARGTTWAITRWLAF